MRRSERHVLLAAVVGLSAVPGPMTGSARAGETEIPSLRAARVAAGAVHVDGRLDEAAWSQAPRAGGLRQREPLEGEPASEQTEVVVLYDDTTLFVGVRARDREPQKIISRLLRRDALMRAGGFDNAHRFAGDDAVAILLDPFRDQRNAVVFATNPNGAEFDALIADESPALNVDWRGIWSVRAERNGEGWSAEFAIPFRTLRYPEGETGRPWGFNVYRVIRRRNEETLWSAWTREAGGFHRVSRAGLLEGLEGLPRRGLNIDVKPFGLGGLERERPDAPAEVETRARLDAGGDLKWEVRPGLVLDLTLNPDFAQVEVDDQQINLTRFDLFFPEKREFFLENAGTFDFGFRGFGEPPPLLLFFSRRIGINEDEEEEVPVIGGVRLSGRVGRQTVGFLDTVTAPAFGEGHVNYGVLRVKRDVGRSHSIGAMVTDRRSDLGSNTTLGADASFWPTGSLNLQGFYARSLSSGAGGEDGAWRLGADMSGDRWGFVAQHLTIGPEFNPEMGFLTREDVRRSDVFGRHTFRPGFGGLRKIDVFFGGQYVSRISGEMQDWNVGPFVGFEWESGESLGGFYGSGFARIDEEFDLSDRVTVPLGDYDLAQYGVFLGTSRNRPWALDAFGFFQENYGGTVDNFGGGVSLAPGSHLTTRLGWSRSQADLPWGAFRGDLWSLRLAWAFSTRLVASAFVQYNQLDDEWLTNVRLTLIHRPGSDLYVVFNEERAAGEVTNRTAIVKLTWLVRF